MDGLHVRVPALEVTYSKADRRFAAGCAESDGSAAACAVTQLELFVMAPMCVLLFAAYLKRWRWGPGRGAAWMWRLRGQKRMCAMPRRNDAMHYYLVLILYQVHSWRHLSRGAVYLAVTTRLDCVALRSGWIP